MRRIIYLCMLLGLGLSSCEKENQNESTEDTIEIEGKMYSLSYLTEKMSNEINVSVDSLIFHHDENVFTVLDYPETKWSVKRMLGLKN